MAPNPINSYGCLRTTEQDLWPGLSDAQRQPTGRDKGRAQEPRATPIGFRQVLLNLASHICVHNFWVPVVIQSCFANLISKDLSTYCLSISLSKRISKLRCKFAFQLWLTTLTCKLAYKFAFELRFQHLHSDSGFTNWFSNLRPVCFQRCFPHLLC